MVFPHGCCQVRNEQIRLEVLNKPDAVIMCHSAMGDLWEM
jgi:hypothetical protein